MAYCTQDDILDQIDEDNLIQLTDDADAGAVDADMVTRAIADADEEIDSYCGARYSVPFTTVPGIVRKLSVDIAIYNLYARRRGAPDDRKERYNNAVRMLRDISKKVISLGADDPDGSPPDTDRPQMSSSNPPRLFSRDTMKGW